MNRMLRFFRTTIAGGILFLVPIVVLLIILGKALALAHRVAVPLAERIPAQSFLGLPMPRLLAIVLIVAFCFLAGVLARTSLAKKIVEGLEASLLSNLPGYEFFKGMGENILGAEKQAAYPVVLVRFDDSWQLAFRIEVLGNGLVAVFIPGAPSPQSGAVCLMSPDRITPVEVPPAAMMKCMRRLGVGTEALLRGLPIEAGPSS
jgi:uncharacterized membrane protein